MTLPIQDGLSIPLEEFAFTYVRSSGPGGQNVNKVSSKAALTWTPAASPTFGAYTDAIARLMKLYPSYFSRSGELMISSQRTRDALKNRQDCLSKLQKMLERALHEPKHRVRTKPTRASHVRRLNDKARNSEKKARRRAGGGDD